MTGVNVEDALEVTDVFAAAIADVAGVAASQVVIDGVSQADRRRLDDSQELLNVAYRITGLTEAKAASAARRMDNADPPVFDAALTTAAAESGPLKTILFEPAQTTEVTGATVTTPRPPTPDPAPSPRPPTPDPAPSPRPPTPEPDPAPVPEPEPEPTPAPRPPPNQIFFDDEEESAPEPAPAPEDEDENEGNDEYG